MAYTIRKQAGKFWVITPSGDVIAIAHATKADANLAANVFNHQNRPENSVSVLRNKKLLARVAELESILECVLARWDKYDDEDAPKLGKAIRAARKQETNQIKNGVFRHSADLS